MQRAGSDMVQLKIAPDIVYITFPCPTHTPTPEARGSGREEQSHTRGALAALAQEGLEELSHVEGQEGQQWGDTPRPR